MSNKRFESITAFAPATCGNAVVGFDIMGFAIAGLGDEVTLRRRPDKNLIIKAIHAKEKIPLDPKLNIASAVLLPLMRDLQLDFGFDITLRKGIPLSSGLGGSAASAVAALIACNGFLDTPLPLDKLVHYALQGEALCSGQAHPDNIVPALYGGMTLITSSKLPFNMVALPILDVVCVLVHPQLQLPTREARQILSNFVELSTHVAHSANLAGVVASLYQNDLSLFKKCLKDVVIEPQRAKLIPGFEAAKMAALEQGALGVSLSGAGPTILAFAENQNLANIIGLGIQQAFHRCDIVSEIFLSPISKQGAHIIART